MIKYKNILIATDFSEIGEQAARQASGLATLLGAKLTIIHVVEHFPEDMPENTVPPENVDPKEFFYDQAYTELEKLRNNLGHPEAILEVLISSYSAGKEIAGYATQKNIDFIVVGAHGKQGPFGMSGSTANRVTHSATVDVLLVHALNQEIID